VVTPPHTAGTVALDVSVNGQQFAAVRSAGGSGSGGYTYAPPPTVSHITPVAGPATSGGTLVTVYGAGFANGSGLACRFADRAVPALWRSTGEVACRVPPITDALRYSSLLTMTTATPGVLSGSRRLWPAATAYPWVYGRLVRVGVTNNGQEYTDEDVNFMLQADARVTGVTPPAVLGASRTVRLFVTGANFVNTSSLACRIGRDVVPAVFLAPSLLTCVAPPPAAARAGGRLGVEVSNNGVDFTRDGAAVTIGTGCPPGAFCPRALPPTLALPCPRGAACPPRVANMTLCGAGSYAPAAGGMSCRRCPIGHVCPGPGMYVPRLCPPGAVCDATGLTRPSAPCPPGHWCLEGTATTATTCGDAREVGAAMGMSDAAVGTAGSGLAPVGSGGGGMAVGGFRATGCWDNSTTDWGLAVSRYPARFWAEAHLLPLAPDAPFTPMRGRYCLDDACGRLADGGALPAPGGSLLATLRRPVPCPPGMYCAAGTGVADHASSNWSTPQPCAESMYCPEGSADPAGAGPVPPGFYSRAGLRTPCPPGTHCPFGGTPEPVPCPPGTYSAQVGQATCAPCPLGAICPGTGRVDPAICPPGWVCSREGLATPNTQCPAGFYCVNGTQTADPFRNDTTLRPYACRPGTYCLAGTGSDRVRTNVPGYAQNCTAGFFCEAASPSPLGSGLCPPGFVCPTGTAVPVPSPRGSYAELYGTIEAARCLPGYYAPTIQTVRCYPCPPGTACENDGAAAAAVCPPGTYHSMAETDGSTCVGCPQGSWSKQWELADAAQCTRCPPGVVCPVDGMRNPCSVADLPRMWVTTLGDEDFFHCNRLPNHVYGVLRPPFVTRRAAATNRTALKGPFITPDPNGRTFNESQCFANAAPAGSIVYQRAKAYYGRLHVMNTGVKHQGYGNDTYYGYFNVGSRAIALATAPRYSPRAQCDSGYFHPTNWTDAQWMPGTCEVDIFCPTATRTQALPCPEGYICEEGTTSASVTHHPCFGGYVCGVGTTPDTSLQAPQGMFATLCTAGYFCLEATGPGAALRGACPSNYFCPTGTYDALLGKLASDALLRGLNATQANPFVPVAETGVMLPGETLPRDVSVHDEFCFAAVNATVRGMTSWALDEAGYNVSTNVSLAYAARCGRDDKWRLNAAAVARGECNCVAQVALVAEVHRLWMCTAAPHRVATCNFTAVRLPAPASLTAPSVTTSWARRVTTGADGERRVDVAVQLPHIASLAGRYFRTCEALVLGAGAGGSSGALEANCSVRAAARASAVAAARAAAAATGMAGAEAAAVAALTGGQLVADAPDPACPVFCSFEEVKAWVEPRFAAAAAASSAAKVDGFEDRITPFLFDLKYAVDLVDELTDPDDPDAGDDDFFRFGAHLPAYVSFVPGLEPLTPLRMDACACESALRCPNGTTSTAGATSIYDCVRAPVVTEVLRRYAPLPASDPAVLSTPPRTLLRDLYEDLGPLPALALRGGQHATVVLNFTGLHVNMTYGAHYRVAVYPGCDPCPPRYRCDPVVPADGTAVCIWPPAALQAAFGVACADCCACQARRMPAWLNSGAPVAPYLDNKHTVVAVSLTPIQDVVVTVAVELLHGMYYTEFEAGMAGVGYLHVHTPSRAAPDAQPLEARTMFLSVIKASDYVGLALPLNLPLTRYSLADGTTSRVFENTLLIDRPPDYAVALSFPGHDFVHAAFPADAFATLTPASTAARRLRGGGSGGSRGRAATAVAGVLTCLDDPSQPYFETPTACAQRLAAGVTCAVNETQVECGARAASQRTAILAAANTRVRPAYVDVMRDAFTDVSADSTLFTAGDTTGGQVNPFTTLALPYFPFLSNCDGYDSHVHMSKLMEEHPDCDLVAPESTVAVAEWPGAGTLVPVADTCHDGAWTADPPTDVVRPGLSLFCTYEEDIFSQPTTLRWLNAPPGTVLWHITHHAWPWRDMMGDYSTAYPGPLWGRTDTVDGWVHTDELIPVTVERGEQDGDAALIPRTVNLTMRYYQVDTAEKRLVVASITFGAFCSVSTLPAVLAEHAAAGFGPCTSGDYAYRLLFSFVPLWWLDLLNYFQFSVGLYLILYLLIGAAVVALSAALWLLHRVCTRNRIIAQLHLLSLARLSVPPTATGVLLASFPVLFVTVAVLAWWIFSRSADAASTPGTLNFEGVSGNWLDTLALTNDSADTYRQARTATTLLFVGVLIVWMSSAMYVPRGSGGDLEAGAGARATKRAAVRATTAVLDVHARAAGGAGGDKAAASRGGGPAAAGGKGREDELWTPARWKRGHFVLVSFAVVAAANVLLEFSYSSVFTTNQFVFIVALRIGVFFTDRLLRTVMKEVLLVAPLMVVVNVLELFVVQGADQFTDFVQAYFVRLVMTTLARLYLEPNLKAGLARIPVAVMAVRRRLHARARLTRDQRAAYEAQWKRLQMATTLENDGVEPILESYIRYSSETAAAMVAPLLMLVVYLLDGKAAHPFAVTQIPARYGIRQTDFVYYTLFYIVIIPFQWGFDVFLFNCAELWHGWKLFDYVSYQAYRYRTRLTRWQLAGQSLDAAIRENLRTADMLCFSSQYYFLLAVHAWGMLLMLVGLQAQLHQGFNMFSDWVLVVILLVVWLALLALRGLLMWVGSAAGLWKRHSVEGTIEDGVAAKLAMKAVQQDDAELDRMELAALNSEDFRQRFLERNRPWLVAHIGDLIPRALLNSGTPQARKTRDYLAAVLASLRDMRRGDAAAGAQLSMEDDVAAEAAAVRAWNAAPPPTPTVAKVARYWLETGRRRAVYRASAAGAIAAAAEPACAACSAPDAPDAPLTSYVTHQGRAHAHALDDVVVDYEAATGAGLPAPVDTLAWKTWFRANAACKTLCVACAALELGGLDTAARAARGRLAAQDRAAAAAAAAAEAAEAERAAADAALAAAVEPESWPDVSLPPTDPTAKLLTKWLTAARVRMGGAFPRPAAVGEVDAYLRGRAAQRGVPVAAPAAGLPAAAPPDLEEDDTGLSQSAAAAAASLPPAQTAMVLGWYFAARRAKFDAYARELAEVGNQLAAMHAQLAPADDWYFQRDRRMRGGELLAGRTATEAAVAAARATVAEGARGVHASFAPRLAAARSRAAALSARASHDDAAAAEAARAAADVAALEEAVARGVADIVATEGAALRRSSDAWRTETEAWVEHMARRVRDRPAR